MPEPFYMTPAALREKLAGLGIVVSDSTLRSWRGRGSGPEWVKVEGSVYYLSDRIEPWLAGAGRPKNADKIDT